MNLINLNQRKLKIKQFLIFAILTSCKRVTGYVYSVCYPYETYCLFWFGPNAIVNNVSEAQKICEDAKNGSWLLEIVDNRTLKNVNEFLSKHSFPEDTKLILNAEKVGNEWKWIKSDSVIRNNIRILLNDDGDALFHQHSKETSGNKYFRFTFICSTGCHSKIIKHEKKRYAGATFQTSKSKTQCLELCEQSECKGWEWKSDDDINGCWTHSTITGSMTDSIGTLFLLDKSVKTTDICVGIVKDPNFSDPQSKLLLLVIVPFVLIMILLVTFTCGLLWRKCKRRWWDETVNKNSPRDKHTEQQNKCGHSPIYSNPWQHKLTKVEVCPPDVIYSEVIL